MMLHVGLCLPPMSAYVMYEQIDEFLYLHTLIVQNWRGNALG